MSIFGALNTAISGLSSQSAAFGNIADNVSNSQTVGYKRVDTSFIDYLTTSNADVNDPGATVARPDYTNNVQGTIAQTDNALGLAITGQGYFAVSEATSAAASTGGATTFSSQPYYSRAGDFTLNKDGYMVNSAGNYLNGWAVDSTTGQINRNALTPIQISQSAYNPVATSEVSLSANLPATPAAQTPVSSQVTVYDSLGTQHVVTLDWTQNAANDWTVAVNSPDDTSAAARGTAEVQFGALSGNAVPEGTVGSIANATGSVTASSFSANSPSTLTFTTDFGTGAQTITLNLGNYGGSSGVTQFAGTDYSLHGLTQNGVPPGSYDSVSTTSAGDIVVNYDNGQSRTIARVPVVTFNAPDALQGQDGQAYTTTVGSGNPNTQDAGTNGAGTIVTNSVEQSNVDIASEFSKLIVAQQAYSANTKVVTTANDMLQQTINMKS